MKRWRVSLIFTIGLLLIFNGPTWADMPRYEEQFVYQLRLFDSNSYPETFIPPSEDTICLLADTNNIVSPRVTLVHFWPLSGRFVAAFKELDERIDGTMEIMKGQKVIRQVGQSEFVLFYPKGITGQKTELHVGEAAYAVFKKYEKPLNDFYHKMSDYNRQMLVYGSGLMKYAKEIEERRERGESLNPEQVEAEMPIKPVQPNRLPFDLTGIQSDYVINLAAGNYRIRLRAPDGTIVEGSEKRLVAFTRRREGGVGYEIIPGNRWTKRESSNDPAEIIYGSGSNKLYFRAFRETEYNEFYYQKLLDPQNQGNPQRWVWVHTRPLLENTLTVQRNDGDSQRIKQTEYLVKQHPGGRLGYEILPYSADRYPDQQPAFAAFKIDFPGGSDAGHQKIWLEDLQGRQIPLSARKMIMVNQTVGNWLYLLSAFPLLVGLLIYMRRHRATA